ncbi:MAG: MATE family efflux transporter [Candidatus Nanohaloarchaeota archaeon QJJ-5]|nr:MATE family efflux transporter [Candidatus Nanohaloarchaeota archaeon QJJ-5]
MRFSDLFKSRDELNLLDGPIGRNLFFLSLPIVITNLLRTAYNLADTFWLGRVGEDALAAITFAFPIVFLLISAGIGLAVAGSVLVAQHEGKGHKKGAEYAASQTVGFGLIVSLVLGILGYFVVGDIVSLLGARPAVAAMATSYLQVVSLGLVFMFGFSIFIALMRGYGDTVTPMLLMLVTVIFNIILDPFFIFGWWIFPELGITGAAIATIACRAFATIAGLIILVTDLRGVKIHFHHVMPEFDFVKKILRIGVPASVESMGTALSVNIMVAIVGLFANSVVAGFGIGIRIFSVVFLPADAMSRGVEAMTGQNIGAKNFGRARTINIVAAKYTFLILLGIGAICFIWAEQIIGVFSTNPSVIQPGAQFLRFVAPTFGFLAIIRAFMGGFRGVGKTIYAAAISIAFVGVFRIPIAYIGAIDYGPVGVWISFPVSIILGAIMATVLFYWDNWDATLVDEEDSTAV